jgi:RimJ/RimL family protein N-acetyltransferase
MPDASGIKCLDKEGVEFEVTYGGFQDRQAIEEMYERFTPKAMTQGLPPANDMARSKWIESLLENGENFLAWREGKLMGHASMIVDNDKRAGEYLIFMDQSCRNLGMGTELTRVAIRRASEMGLDSVWLTVEALNFRAIKLYKKMGFAFCDAGERERTMILRL